MLQHLEALRDVSAMVIEADEDFVAGVGEHAGGGDLEGFVVGLRPSERRVGGVERSQRGADGGLERGEPGELALQSERVARDHRSRSRVSASMTRTTTSRSTSLRFLRAVSRRAAVASRSRSRMAPTVASWSSTVASEAKT